MPTVSPSLFVNAYHPADVDLLAIDESVAIAKADLVVLLGVVVIHCLVHTRLDLVVSIGVSQNVLHNETVLAVEVGVA